MCSSGRKGYWYQTSSVHNRNGTGVRVCPYSDYCVCFFTLFFSFFFVLSSSSLKKREKSGLHETVGIPLAINWKVLRGWGGVVFCCKIITERKENHVLIIVYIH